MFEETQPVKKIEMGSIKSKIIDSIVNLTAFFLYKGIEAKKEAITESNLQSLEDYVGMESDVLENFKPGVCDIYNGIITELKDKNLTEEKFNEIMQDINDFRTCLSEDLPLKTIKMMKKLREVHRIN